MPVSNSGPRMAEHQELHAEAEEEEEEPWVQEGLTKEEWMRKMQEHYIKKQEEERLQKELEKTQPKTIDPPPKLSVDALRDKIKQLTTAGVATWDFARMQQCGAALVFCLHLGLSIREHHEHRVHSSEVLRSTPFCNVTGPLIAKYVKRGKMRNWEISVSFFFLRKDAEVWG